MLRLGLGVSGLVLAACMFTPPALAGYPVQPSDGKTLTTLAPTFLVYKDADEVGARVDIATSPETGAGGALRLGPGYLGSCLPVTPFGEPGKFSCTPRFAREGTYFWQFVVDKNVCETVNGYRSCSYRRQYGPVWRFELALAPSPETFVLPVVNRAATFSRVNSRYSAVASKLARRSVVVKCWSNADWNLLHVESLEYEGGDGLRTVLGYVRPGMPVIHLAPAVCSRLDLLMYARKRPNTRRAKIDMANAVGTLVHEAFHTADIRNEAVAECYAMQLVEHTSTQIGVGWRYGRELARLLWGDYASLIGTPYYTPDCYDGGPLDLYPGETVWP